MKLEDAAQVLATIAPRRRLVDSAQSEMVSEGLIPRRQFVNFDAEDAAALVDCAKSLYDANPAARAWDQHEFVRLVFMFVSGGLETPAPTDELEARVGLTRLIKVTDVLVAMPLANVAWDDEPFITDDFVMGVASDEWATAVQEVAGTRSGLPPAPPTCWWLDPLDPLWQQRIVPAFATWIRGKRGRQAVAAAIQRFDELAAMCLLADEDPEKRELYSGNGPSHRPGVRGHSIDRASLLRLVENHNAEAIGTRSADIVVGDELGGSLNIHLYGEDPFPLKELLQGSRQREMLAHLTARAHISHRFRTAARWYGKAHWAESSEDRILALGIAVDALLGEQSGVPGREIIDRFALLAPEADRPERAQRMRRIYEARSAVAHGGAPREIDDVGFLREVERDVRWVASALHRTTFQRGAENRAQIRKLFEDLKWGLVQPEPVAGG